jgi:hypothetical protein
LSWQIAELNERRTQIEDLLKRAGSLDEEKPQLQHQLARSGELRDSMLQQQAEAGKSQRDKLMIVAAFLLAIVPVMRQSDRLFPRCLGTYSHDPRDPNFCDERTTFSYS